MRGECVTKSTLYNKVQEICLKHNIEGYDQAKLIEYKLDYVDAIILRWYTDFSLSGKMTEAISTDGKRYYWVNYKGVLDALPILGFKSRDRIYRTFKKFVSCGLMEHYIKKQGGTYSCYRLNGDKYGPLQYSEEVSVSKPVGYGQITGGGTVREPERNTLPLDNTSVNNSKIKNVDFSDLITSYPSLNNPEFEVKFGEWITHRAEIKHKLTPSAARLQLKFLSGYDCPTAIEIINTSIMNGWQGLFEPKKKGGGRSELALKFIQRGRNE